MEQKKQEFDQGKARKITKEWRRVTVRLNRARQRAVPLTGDHDPAIQAKQDWLKQKIRELDRLQKRTPAGDPLDPGYKRLFIRQIGRRFPDWHHRQQARGTAGVPGSNQLPQHTPQAGYLRREIRHSPRQGRNVVPWICSAELYG